jgi:hypothetical protein
MRLPRHLLLQHPANTPLAVRAMELTEHNEGRLEQLWRAHETNLRAVYTRLYPDDQEPIAVLRRIRARRGLK